MKKFTKVCLFAALTLFIIGCIFCGVFGMMGGFRQLDSANRNGVFGNLRTVLWGYKSSWFDWGGNDWDEERWTEMKNISTNTESALQTNYNVDDISDIDIELGGENLIITESEDDYIWIKNSSGNNNFKYGRDGSTFKLYSTNSIKFWKNVSRGNIYLYLPKSVTLKSIDLEVGAGRLNSIALKADEISLDIGAGEFYIEGMSGRKVNISVGAGKANIDSIDADEADISVGAGSISARGINIRDISLEVGMGNIDVTGTISGNADVECGMGNINMFLQGSEADHDYYLECAMGSIRVGSNKYSGIASEKVIDNGSDSKFDVECAMGNIDISFE